MRLERVAVGDVIKARIKGRSVWNIARADSHGRDGWAVGLPRRGQHLLELLTAALPRDNDLALLASHIKSPLMRGWPRNSAYRPHIGAASASGSSPSPPLQRASSHF